jgi:hypothetical protein
MLIQNKSSTLELVDQPKHLGHIQLRSTIIRKITFTDLWA